MSDHRWQLLDTIRQSLTNTGDLPSGILPALAERLDEALSAPSRDELDALNQQLAELFEQLLDLSPPACRDAIEQTSAPDSAENAAYQLGQISFAQLLTAQAAERRVDDEFMALMQDSRYQPYVNALAKQAQTGKELAELCGEVEETVSRKLKMLREYGISDFRREGTRLFNFLTPAAHSVVTDWQTTPQTAPGLPQAIIAQPQALARLRNETSPHFRQAMTLSTMDRKAA